MTLSSTTMPTTVMSTTATAKPGLIKPVGMAAMVDVKIVSNTCEMFDEYQTRINMNINEQRQHLSECCTNMNLGTSYSSSQPNPSFQN